MPVTCKTVFIAASGVTLACVLLFMSWMVISGRANLGPMIESRRNLAPLPHSDSSLVPTPGDEATVNSTPSSTQHDSQLSPSVINKAQCTPVGGNVLLLGKRPERCTTPGTDDIYISIKTTRRYHKTRLSMLILTWLQTVKPEQVNSTASCSLCDRTK